MIGLDYPPINVEERSNEENLQSVKGYLINMVDALENKVASLEERLQALEGKNDGNE